MSRPALAVLDFAIREFFIRSRQQIADVHLKTNADGSVSVDLTIRAVLTRLDVEFMGASKGPRDIFERLNDRITGALIAALPEARRGKVEFCERYGHPKTAKSDPTCYCGRTEGYFVAEGDASPWPRVEG